MKKQLLKKLETLLICAIAPDDVKEFAIWLRGHLTEEERTQLCELLESGYDVWDLAVELRMKGYKVKGMPIGSDSEDVLGAQADIALETQRALSSHSGKPDTLDDLADLLTRHLKAIDRYDLLEHIAKNQVMSGRVIYKQYREYNSPKEEGSKTLSGLDTEG